MTSAAASNSTEQAPAEQEHDAFLSAGWRMRSAKLGLLGLGVVALGFPQLIDWVVRTNISNPTAQSIVLWPSKAIQSAWGIISGANPSDFFERSMGVGFALFFLCLILAALISFKERHAGCIKTYAAGLLGGFISFHIIAWLAVLVVGAIGVGIFLASTVGDVAGAVAGFVIGQWLIIAALVLGTTGIIFREEILQNVPILKSMLAKYWPKILAVFATVVFLIWAFPIFLDWVVYPFYEYILKPVGYFIAWLFGIFFGLVFALLLAFLACASLVLIGSLVFSQVQAGLLAAGNDRLGLVAGFAIGSLLTLILTISVANPLTATGLDSAFSKIVSLAVFNDVSTTGLASTFVWSLPASVEEFIFANLTDQQAPAFDSLLLVLIVSLTAMSFWYRLRGKHRELDREISIHFVATEYLKMAFGLFVFVALVFFSGLMQQE